jgi:hypothetical protein
MPRRHDAVVAGTVLVAVLTLGTAAGAQVVSGTVIDSLSRRPIPGVTITARSLRDSAVLRGGATDSLGRFRLVLPRPDTVFVTARRIGLEPLETAPRFIDATGERRLQFEMSTTPQLLDTVRTKGQSKFGGWLSQLTSGQDWFARHYRAGKGYFTSAAEIQLSGLAACDYFAGVPGFVVRRAGGGIPCSDYKGVVRQSGAIAAIHAPCLDGYVDRRHKLLSINRDGISLLIDGTKDDVRRVPLSAIRGIEFFARYEDRPDDFSWVRPAQPVMRDAAGTQPRLGPDSQRVLRPARFTSERQVTRPLRCAMMLVWTAQYWGE